MLCLKTFRIMFVPSLALVFLSFMIIYYISKAYIKYCNTKSRDIFIDIESRVNLLPHIRVDIVRW